MPQQLYSTTIKALLAATLAVSFDSVQSHAQSQLDTSYNPSISGQVTTNATTKEGLALQPDDKVLIGGNFTQVGTTPIRYFARINANGTLDTNFNTLPNSLDTIDGPAIGTNSISVQLDGNILVSGLFSRIGSHFARQLARLNPDGSANSSFDAPKMVLPNDTPGDLDLDYVISPTSRPLPDGSALVGGYFTEVDNNDLAHLFRASNTGEVETAFNANINGSNFPRVIAIVPQPDGKIIIGGNFNTVGGSTRNYIARLNADGTLDNSFNPNANYYVSGIVLQPDGKLLVYGFFSSIGGGSAASGFARLNSDGTLDPSFNPGFVDGWVYSLGLRADGKILVGGTFDNIGGQFRSKMAVLNTNGTASAEYAAETVNNYVYQTAIQGNGKVVIAGTFSGVSGNTRNRIARLHENVSAVQSLAIDSDGTTITWTRTGSAPEVEEVEFQQSLNGGSTFTKLAGTPTRISNGWTLSGLQLPGGKDFIVRARGTYSSGYFNTSLSTTETRTAFNRPKPVITLQPAHTNAIAGDTNITFTVAATSAATITGYQWKKNGINIPGATSATYIIPGPVTVANDGLISVAVTSTAGTTLSTSAKFKVYEPINITTDLSDKDVAKGKSITLKIVVTGTLPTYVWKKNGTPIPNATSASYTISNAQTALHQDNYSVTITNYAGSEDSLVMNLNVVETLPVINTQPVSQMVAAGTTSAPIGVNVTADGMMSYQWLKNAAVLAGATANPLVLNNTPLSAAGKYNVKAFNVFGFALSGIAEVGVVETTIPTKLVVGNGGTATMTAPAAGNSLTYVWKFNGTPIDLVANAARMSVSSGGKVLKIVGVTTADAGPYTCTVTGPGGTLTSAAQMLVVTTTAPEIAASLDFPNGMVGSPYSYTIPVNNDSAAPGDGLRTPTKFIISGLPAGLTYNALTGVISGRPTTAKTVTVKVKASNANGTSIELSDTLTIQLIPTQAVGTFVGLISRNGAGDNLGGRLDLTTTAAGTYSGKLTQGTKVYPFTKGRLDIGTTYNNTNNIVVKRGTALPPVTLSFDIDTGTGLLTGSVSDGTSISGWRNTFTATSPTTTFTGLYNFGMQPPAPSSPGDQTHPLGYGYGSFKILPVGTLTVSGKLADGTAYSTAGFVGPNGQVLIYKAFTTIASVHGVLTVTPAGAAPLYPDSSVAGTPTWLKKASTGRLYAAGFGPIFLNASGFKYNTVAGQNLLGVDTLTNDAELQFLEGLDVTTSPNGVEFRISATNAVTMPTFASGNNPASITCTVAAGTGIFSGSFVQNDDTDPSPTVTKILKRTATYNGIVVRQGTQVGTGYGFFLLNCLPTPPTTTSLTSPTLSGSVTLGKDIP